MNIDNNNNNNNNETFNTQSNFYMDIHNSVEQSCLKEQGDESSVAVQTSPLANSEIQQDIGKDTFMSSSLGLGLLYDLVLTAGPKDGDMIDDSPYTRTPAPPPDPNARARERTRRTCQDITRESQRSVSISLQRFTPKTRSVSKSLMSIEDYSP